MLMGRFCFGEDVSYTRWFGCALIVAGVGAIARG
jgi:multidrug transporter EmrE-like cation transporter